MYVTYDDANVGMLAHFILERYTLKIREGGLSQLNSLTEKKWPQIVIFNRQ